MDNSTVLRPWALLDPYRVFHSNLQASVCLIGKLKDMEIGRSSDRFGAKLIGSESLLDKGVQADAIIIPAT